MAHGTNFSIIWSDSKPINNTITVYNRSVYDHLPQGNKRRFHYWSPSKHSICLVVILTYWLQYTWSHRYKDPNTKIGGECTIHNIRRSIYKTCIGQISCSHLTCISFSHVFSNTIISYAWQLHLVAKILYFFWWRYFRKIMTLGH